MSIVLMIIASLIAGYLATMNMWVANPKHIRFHMNDLYMVLLMTAWMFLLSYILLQNSMGLSVYGVIIVIIFIVCITYAIRTQSLIDDRQYMNGMIPHHSMAILMSDKILQRTKDPRIEQLARSIIKSQQEEIDIMDRILNETEITNNSECSVSF